MVPWWPVPKARGGLDLDADLVAAHARPIVRAVHHETAATHDIEAVQRLRDPVHFGHHIECNVSGGSVTCCSGNKRAQGRFVGRPAEVSLHQPRAGVPVARARRFFKGGGRGVRRIERFDDDVGDAPRGHLIAAQAHQMRGIVRRQAFEHRPRLAYGFVRSNVTQWRAVQLVVRSRMTKALRTRLFHIVALASTLVLSALKRVSRPMAEDGDAANGIVRRRKSWLRGMEQRVPRLSTDR